MHKWCGDAGGRGRGVPGQQYRHMAGTQWGNKKYMNMKHLEAVMDDVFIAG